MAEKKTIAIMGATGAQGGGLARAILDDPNGGFAVRAITRDAGSDKARDLAQRGAEVVEADLDNPSSIAKAFSGAYGAYCVTFYWDHFTPAKEIEHAKTMAEAARDAGVQHVIWSTLEDTRKWIPLSDDRMPTLMEKYKVPHFDAKAEADRFFVDAGVPTTFLVASFYWDNMIFFGMGPKTGPDGKLGITFPMGDRKLAGVAAEDIGGCAYGIFKSAQKYAGKFVGIAGEHLTGHEMAATLTKALGREIGYNAVPPDTFRGFGFPGADDIGNMFQFYHDFDQVGLALRDVDMCRELNPKLQSFKEWCAKNKDNIPLE